MRAVKLTTAGLDEGTMDDNANVPLLGGAGGTQWWKKTRVLVGFVSDSKGGLDADERVEVADACL